MNVSALQIVRADFAETLESLLAEYELPARLLEIELTESAQVPNVEAAGRQSERLCADGITLALDDFGAGFAGIGVLQWFPAHVIKIDKSVVEGIESSATRRCLVSGIVAFARELGATTVAEGVENRRQLAALAEIGCDQAQGFVFGVPAGAEGVVFDFAHMGAGVCCGLAGTGGSALALH